jgi:hypothetical protein
MNCNRIVALCVAGLAGATCVWGDACGVSPNTATGAYGSDTVFSPSGVTTQNPTGDSPGSCADQSSNACPPVTATISVTRVVGGSNALNPDGTLKNPSLASSGSVAIVSQYAYLSAGSGTPWSPSGIVVTFNGNVLSDGKFVSSTKGLVNGDNRSLGGCYQIPIGYVKFAQRNPGRFPNPGVNKVVVAITSKVPNRPNIGNDTNSITYGATALSFKAMAPVIMVHGWRSGPWWWDDPLSPPPGGGSAPVPNCGTTDRNFVAGNGTHNGGFGFVDPFTSGGYPFDCSIQINPTAAVPDGAIELRQDLLRCGAQSATTIVFPDSNFVCPDGSRAMGKLAEFGAKHAHLVVHSLGGLWTRQMIDTMRNQTDLNGNNLFGLYSVTTLETPHLGSSLADLLIAGQTDHLLQLHGILSLDLRIIATFFQDSAGAFELQVGKATALNKQLGIPPAIFRVDGSPSQASYYSVGSDADVNNNQIIDGASNPGDANQRPDEGYPPPPKIPTAYLATVVQNARFRWLAQVNNAYTSTLTLLGKTILSGVDFSPTDAFQLNDITVTVASALGGAGFPPATQNQSCNNLPCRLANHTTAGSSMNWNQAAQQVLGLMLQAQPK